MKKIKYEIKIPQYKLVKEPTDFKMSEKIRKAEDVIEYLRPLYNGTIGIYESFFMVVLNRAARINGYVKISQGGVGGTVVDSLLLTKYAVEALAASVIFTHNHPSGNKDPSAEDIKLTKELKKGLNYFNITLLDHIIITEKDFYSFANDGQI